jgi:hypothetical protein
MKNPMLVAKKFSLRAALLLPLAGLVAFAGCSSIDGTTASQPVTKSRVAAYMEQSAEKPANTPADTDEDPGYEWFY